MLESYAGMDTKYFVGCQPVFKCDASEILEYEDNIDGSQSTSGRSSNTGTQLTTTSQAEGAAADMTAVEAHQAVSPPVDRRLPTRRHKRKPDRRTVKSETETPAVTSPIRKRGRRPKAAGNKPRSPKAARSSAGNNSMAGRQKRLQVKAPPTPPTPRTRPPRNTPKKFWAEDEVEAWWDKKGGAAQAMVEEEEEELTDYTPSPARKGRASGPKKTQSQGGGASHPSRKKAGGPCVSCHVDTSVTWRKGSQGQAYAGQPLCNRCGVWYSRHLGSPPGAFAHEARMVDQVKEDAQQARMMEEAAQQEGLQGGRQEGLQGGQQEGQQEEQQGAQQGAQQGGGQKVTRRRVTTPRACRQFSDPARANSEQPFPHSTAVASQPLPLGEATAAAQAQAGQPIFRTTAVDEAAMSVAVAPAIGMQQSAGGNTLMGRAANATQDSIMQPVARSGITHMDESSAMGQEADVQLRQVGGAKMSRKRAAVEECVQPAAKRWQLEASFAGSLSHKETLWGMASAAAARVFGGGRNSMEAPQGEGGVSEGDMATHINTLLDPVRKDDWEHV